MERYHKQVVVRDKIVCIRFEIKLFNLFIQQHINSKHSMATGQIAN